MRFRIWALLAVLVLLLIPAGCATVRVSRGPEGTPVPIKTLRPTFTNTPATPTEIPPTATPVASPTSTPEPATPTPEEPTATATPATVDLTVTTATANVRSGPGTNYAKVGQVRQGETYEVTGKNQAGDWWEFTFNGQPAWIFKDMVSVNGADRVQLASNLPAPPPTAKPRPTSPPAPPQPTQPPAPTYRFSGGNADFRNAENTDFTVVTFWGRLGQTSVAKPVSDGYKMRATTPTGTQEVVFEAVWQRAYSGYKSSEFLYNAKVELPRTAGGFTAVVLDGGGQQVAPAASGTLLDNTHDVILTWWPN